MKPELYILFGGIIFTAGLTGVIGSPLMFSYWWAHDTELSMAVWYGCRIFSCGIISMAFGFALVRLGMYTNNKLKSKLKEEKVGAHPL